MKIKKKSISGIVLIVFAAVILAISIRPRYKYSFSYIELFAISVPFLFLFVFRYYTGIRKTQWIFIFLVLIAVFRFLINTFMNLSAALNTSLILYLCMLGYLIFEALSIRNNQSEILLVIVFLTLMLGYIELNTFREFSENPMVARILAYGATDDEYLNLLRFNNIGGFGFSYAMGMLNPYFAMLIIRNKGMNRIIPICLLIANFTFCAFTQYTTLLMLSIFFIIYVFTTKMRNIGLKYILLVTCGAVLLNLRNILMYFALNTDLNALSYHLADIVSMLGGEASSSSRSSLYADAIGLFFQNPLFGADLTDSGNLVYCEPLTFHALRFACQRRNFGDCTVLWCLLECDEEHSKYNTKLQ